MELYIDTSDRSQLVVRILNNGKLIAQRVEEEQTKADQVLIVIEELLKEANVERSDLRNISVNRGPGSFTGVRVGVSIANTLAFALGISVNNKEIGKLEEPVYS